MNAPIERLKQTIEPMRQEIVNHPVYSHIRTIDDLKVFMQYHVYAVWDFMSLLKSLQNSLTCTTVPWYPKGTADSRFLINEIVVGEESDVDQQGIRKSHFELYLDAMEQCGADTSGIRTFLDVLLATGDLELAFSEADTPAAARNFVRFTFEVIQSDKDYLQSAVFTFGREDLIPGMFYAIIKDMHRSEPERVSIFNYYLERHIEVDGDHHSHLALQMTANLCGEDGQRWQEAEATTIQALKQRVNLWDGVQSELNSNRAVVSDSSLA